MIRPSARLRASRPLLVALLAAGLAGYLGGCGGTSTDAGNPEITMSFRMDGDPVQFRGIIQIYADAASPGFYLPPPDDGGTHRQDDRPELSLGSGNLFINVPPSSTRSIDWKSLVHASDYRVLLPRLPGNADDDAFVVAAEKGPNDDGSVQPFNMYFDGLDGTSAFVRGLTYDPGDQTFRDADGNAFDVLEVELAPHAGYTGTVDTTGLAGRPLAVYTPGSPLAAPVRDGQFRLERLPHAKLAAHIVTDAGVVYAVAGEMDATAGSPQSYGNVLSTLIPGAAVDTVDVPPPGRVLGSPKATPPGPQSFTDSLVIVLTAPDGAEIFYTINGSEPGLSSTPYKGPIVLRGSATLQAVAYRQGINHSAVSVHSYLKVPRAPVAAPGSRAFRDSLAVTLTAAAADAVIHYTLDGTDPTTESPAYSRPLVLTATTTLKAVTAVPNLEPSAITEAHYILLPDSLAAPQGP